MIKNINKLSKRQIITIILLCLVFSRIEMFLLYVIKFNDFSFNNFLGRIDCWDAAWYRSIVQNLYVPGSEDATSGQANWAFFPLMPLIIRIIWLISGEKISISLLAFIVNPLFMMMAEWYAYKYILLTRDNNEEGIFYIIFLSFDSSGIGVNL